MNKEKRFDFYMVEFKHESGKRAAFPYQTYHEAKAAFGRSIHHGETKTLFACFWGSADMKPLCYEEHPGDQGR